MEVSSIDRTLEEISRELRFIHELLQRHGNTGCQNSGVGCQARQSTQNNG